MIYDAPVVVQSYTSEDLLLEHSDELRGFLNLMGRETRQGAVGLVVDRDYLEIRFPETED